MHETEEHQRITLLWPKVQDALAWDGSLRDVYILNTTASDWDAILDALKNHDYPLQFFLDDVLKEIPSSFDSIPKGGDAPAALLSINVAGVLFNTHFFTDEEVEFDLDPRQINESTFPAVYGFLKFLSEITGKECLLTETNWSVAQGTAPILTVNPAP